MILSTAHSCTLDMSIQLWLSGNTTIPVRYAECEENWVNHKKNFEQL